MNNKKILTILLVILIILMIELISIVIYFKNTNNEEVPPKKEDNIVKETIKFDGEVIVTDYKISTQDNKKWTILLNIKNTSSEKIELKQYELNIYDKDKNLVKSLGINLNITLEAQEIHIIEIESIDDLTATTKIEIIKK